MTVKRYVVGRDKPKIENALGLAKSIAGQCVDEEPHLAIRQRVNELIKMLYKIKGIQDNH